MCQNHQNYKKFEEVLNKYTEDMKESVRQSFADSSKVSGSVLNESQTLLESYEEI